MYGLVLLRSRDDASILTSGVASSYVLYLQWTALSSGTDPDGNVNLNSRALVIWQIWLGIFFTVIPLFTVSASTKSDDETSVTAEAGGHLLEKKEDLENRPDDAPAEA